MMVLMILKEATMNPRHVAQNDEIARTLFYLGVSIHQICMNHCRSMLCFSLRSAKDCSEERGASTSGAAVFENIRFGNSILISEHLRFS